jgi:hypothetical protein
MKHSLIQRQIRHNLLQPRILSLELAQPPHLRRHQSPHTFFRQLKNVGWLIPAFRHTSVTGTPSSRCLMMNAFCASVNFDAFIASDPVQPEGKISRIL